MLSPDATVQIGRYADFLDEVAPPVTLDEIVTERLGPGIVQPLPPRPPKKRTERWAYALAVIIALLTLFGGGIWLTGARDDGARVATQPEIEPTATTVPDDTPTPTAQAEPPNTVQSQPSSGLSGDSGTADTPVGPVPWVHATQIGLLPYPGEVIQTPGGFAGVAHPEGSTGSSQWATSSDGARWVDAPFPVPVDPQAMVRVGEDQGVFWLADGARLWLSDDAEIWTETDLPDLMPPRSAGVVWTPSLESPAVRGDLAVFPLELQPELPVQEIFDPGSDFAGRIHHTNCGWDAELAACQDVSDDVDVVFGVDLDTGEQTLLARFRLEAEGEAAYVVDVDTGSRVHEFSIGGFSGEQLTRISGVNLHWNAVLLVGTERAGKIVEAPWSSFGLRSVFVAAVEDRFVAYVDNGPPHGSTTLAAIEMWDSADGLTWTGRGAVDFGIEAPGEVDVMLFDEGDGRTVAAIFPLPAEAPPSDSSLPYARLVSHDGVNWHPYLPDVPGAHAQRIEGGFVSIGDGVFVSKDGADWEELYSFERPVWFDIVGDTLMVAGVSEGTHGVWAFDIEP